LAYDPFRSSVSNLVGEPDAIQIPISLHINKKKISDRALAKVFEVFNTVADDTDHELVEGAWHYFSETRDERRLAHAKVSELGPRFLVVGISHGSVFVAGTLLLGAVWVIKNVLGDGWKQSQTKRDMDAAIANIIDHAAQRVVVNLKRRGNPLSRLLMREPIVVPHEKGKAVQITLDEYPKLEYHPEEKQH
jgi:hypothetical protein